MQTKFWWMKEHFPENSCFLLRLNSVCIIYSLCFYVMYYINMYTNVVCLYRRWRTKKGIGLKDYKAQKSRSKMVNVVSSRPSPSSQGEFILSVFVPIRPLQSRWGPWDWHRASSLISLKGQPSLSPQALNNVEQTLLTPLCPFKLPHALTHPAPDADLLQSTPLLMF